MSQSLYILGFRVGMTIVNKILTIFTMVRLIVAGRNFYSNNQPKGAGECERFGVVVLVLVFYGVCCGLSWFGSVL